MKRMMDGHGMVWVNGDRHLQGIFGGDGDGPMDGDGMYFWYVWADHVGWIGWDGDGIKKAHAINMGLCVRFCLLDAKYTSNNCNSIKNPPFQGFNASIIRFIIHPHPSIPPIIRHLPIHRPNYRYP